MFQLQKSKEREERLEEVIQAYEKIHLEKSNVQRDLDKMVIFHCIATVLGSNLGFILMCVCVCQTTLAEQHVERICSLESALRQRETSLQKLSAQLRSKDAHQAQLHASLDVPRGGFSLDHGSVSGRERRNTTIKLLVAESSTTHCNRPFNNSCPFLHCCYMCQACVN